GTISVISKRNRGGPANGFFDPSSLIVEKCEELIVQNGGPETTAKLILVVLRLWLLVAVGEEIVCVEKLVAPVFVSIAVKLIGSALCRQDDRGIGTPAILRRIRIGDHLEFLMTVHRWAGRLRSQLLNILSQ